jgi:hypothetical protein
VAKTVVRTPTTATQKWSAENRSLWTGARRRGAAFELLAENTVPVWMNQVRPSLVVRCIAGKTDLFVLTGSALKIEPDTEEHTVSLSVDDETAEADRWPDSADHDALFAPDGAALARRLARARTFRFGYTPHNASPVTAVFHVSGLAPHVEPVARECGWKP